MNSDDIEAFVNYFISLDAIFGERGSVEDSILEGVREMGVDSTDAPSGRTTSDTRIIFVRNRLVTFNVSRGPPSCVPHTYSANSRSRWKPRSAWRLARQVGTHCASIPSRPKAPCLRQGTVFHPEAPDSMDRI
jgi:hypothetical protein